MKLSLSRQLMKCVYNEKLKYELHNQEEMTMSEFIEECLMTYLKINLTDLKNEKIDFDVTVNIEGSENQIDQTEKEIVLHDYEYETEIKFDNYVYVYMNPLKKIDRKIIVNVEGEDYFFEHEPFYIGKGKCLRMYEHLKMNGDNQLLNQTISEIKSNGLEPIICLLRNELSSEEAFKLENIIITKLKKLTSLTNISGGKSSYNNFKRDDKRGTIEYDKNKLINYFINSGMTTKEISERMNLSERTIYRMKKSII